MITPYPGSKSKLFSLPINYETLLAYPPKNVMYYPILKPKINIKMRHVYVVYKLFNMIGMDIKRLYNNLLLNKKKKNLNSNQYDIIHSVGAVISGTDYILDVEAISNLIPDLENKDHILSIEQHLINEECKHIICWSEYVKDRMIGLFPKLINKISVVYPAIDSKPKNNINIENVRMTFIGWDFLRKGGWEVLESVRRLVEHHPNVELNVVSKVPEKILNEYSEIKQIKIIGPQKRDVLYTHIYPNTDLLIYPTKFEAFGLVTLEAYSFGIPVLGSDSPVQKELIKNELFVVEQECSDCDNNGFFLTNQQEEYIQKKNNYCEYEVEQMVIKMTTLINNPNLIVEEGLLKYKEVQNGRFSIEKRNENIKKLMYKIFN